jgi:hypothetical protein
MYSVKFFFVIFADKRLTMLKQIILLSLCIIAFKGHSQYNHEQIDINNIEARVNSNAALFTKIEYDEVFHTAMTSSGFEVPKGNNTHGIYGSNIWMGAFTEDNDLRTAAEKLMLYNQSGVKYDINFGPVAIEYDSLYNYRYNRVWKVTKDKIITHQNNYGDIGYEMPEVILNWPAHGNVSNGESNQLAPFVDANNNQMYDPENGDYPIIRGDMTIFNIMTDAAHKNVYSNSDSMGVEIHRMVYGYNKSGHLGNTIFINYKIINRSNTNYHDFYFGKWNDFDLGNAGDDYIGCNPSKNLYYCYNGDSIDENWVEVGYGLNPPAIGCTFLNYDMHAFVYHNSGGGVIGDPQASIHYYNYLTARWLDSTHVVAGGNGHYSSGTFENTNFMFNGNPATQEGWTEKSVGHQPGDRRGVGSVGPFNFNIGDTINIDLAINFASSGVSNLASVTTLFESTDSIKEFYDNQVFADLTAIVAVDKQQQFSIYPNPVKETLTVMNHAANAIGSIKIYDITGKLMIDNIIAESKKQVNVSNLPAGIYMVHIVNNNDRYVERLIVR